MTHHITNPNVQKLEAYGSGSYLASDVTVLLDIVAKDAVADVPVNQKEALIQSGQRHYSDMLTLEQAPTAMHEQLYTQALEQGAERTATDIANLAYTLHHIFQKSRKDGYDGKGVQFLKSEADLEKMLQAPSIFETPADLDREIAVVTVADHLGNIVTYPTVEFVINEEYNLLDYLLMPSTLPKEITDRAEQIARDVVKALKSPGVFAVELFLNKDQSIWVNETASRVHNSGHSTIEAAYSSQFDQMLRTLMQLPLGSAKLFTTSAMVNLIGAEGQTGQAEIENIEELLTIPGTFLHWYAKTITKPGRKMGHVTLVNDDLEQLKQNIKQVNATVKIVAKK